MNLPLFPITKPSDIPAELRSTPIADLLVYHNLGRRFKKYTRAQLLISMCMDSRKQLRIPSNFAYILRSGGANLRYSGFKVSYAIAVGGVRHIALIAHNHCGMVNLASQKERFVNGLVQRAGWQRRAAEKHFKEAAPRYEIGNEIDFILRETRRLRTQYPKVQVAPLFYRIEDSRLYCVAENHGSR